MSIPNNSLKKCFYKIHYITKIKILTNYIYNRLKSEILMELIGKTSHITFSSNRSWMTDAKQTEEEKETQLDKRLSRKRLTEGEFQPSVLYQLDRLTSYVTLIPDKIIRTKPKLVYSRKNTVESSPSRPITYLTLCTLSYYLHSYIRAGKSIQYIKKKNYYIHFL